MTSGRAVLLIADIGGYTDYMGAHRMSLAHAEVNTGRMLERMIDAAPGFDLIEIEGDAAFLSLPVDEGEADASIPEILDAAVAMHRAFHLERQYVTANLCPCKGCKGAADLKLKFVAHVGEVATQTIRDRIKLVGIDVIQVHRMLKNPVGIPEYVLLSEELYRTGEHTVAAPVQEVSPELEGFGTVRAYFVDVGDLENSPAPLLSPSWPKRVGQTFAAVGPGLPYMLGLRSMRSAETAR
ncbi:hypothetical protein ASE14_08050 [Agromyces sp. Root81]|uniref:DUF2652 domain-containing protein n=1 Tax=Agromyces sp. Root81 TaxID=1736601 RepID=UPI0006F83B14|nr:DUF2652 domain-containing protein [Agromyces sp. Root81]KRC60903.1 hypothetical protein ASE14_08050 [Agromyces sp. Root81]